MKILPVSCVLIALAVGCSTHIAISQQFSPHALSQEEITSRQNLIWAGQSWNGDDKPYQRIRSSIDKAISSGIQPAVLRVQYGLKAEQSPNDPQAQFAWAYASWETRMLTPTTSDKYRILYGVPEALAHIPFPRTYQFARIRFLVEADNPALRALGERLLARNSGDTEVKEHLIEVYQSLLLRSDIVKTVPPGLKIKAVSYAEDMIRAAPNNPKCRENLGWVYLASWHRSNDKADGEQAISNFKEYLRLAPAEYLRLAPANDPWRKDAQSFINLIQSKQ